VYRGVNAADPINAYATVDKVGSETADPATLATPAVTTTVPGCLALAGLSPDSQIDLGWANSCGRLDASLLPNLSNLKQVPQGRASACRGRFRPGPERRLALR
jgi:hypothetical protein